MKGSKRQGSSGTCLGHRGKIAEACTGQHGMDATCFRARWSSNLCLFVR